MTAIMSPCGNYRFRLERDCSLPFPGSKVIAYFGVNPSTADAVIDDQTVKKWRGFTIRNQGHRFIVGNVFSYRSKDVEDLQTAPLMYEDEHWNHIRGIIADADLLVPCWGSRNKLPPRAVERLGVFLELLLESGKPVFHLGLTKTGDPSHPLLLGYDTPFTPWPRPAKALPPEHQVEVDARGLHCPIPLLHTKQALNRMSPGEIVKVVATDAGTRRDFAAHCTIAGHTIKHSREQAGELTYWIERGQL